MKKVFAWALVIVVLGAVFGISASLLKQHFTPRQNSAVTLQKQSASPSAEEATSTANPNCVNEGREDFECYKAYYTDYTKKNGVAAAFVDLKKRYATSPAVQSECHQITHQIGHAGARLSDGVGKAFAIGDAMCWSGYYHGVMEETLEGVGTTSLKAKLNTICADIPGKATYSFDYYNCVHGLGHGVMLLYDDDLMTSLDACGTLTGEWEQSSCSGGVFMENIMIESRGGKSAFLKPEDPIYPCDAVSGIFKSQCYLMQTSHMLTAVNGDFNKVFELCSTVEEPFRDTCYQSLGRDASGRSVSNAQVTKATCSLAPDQRGLQNCVIGAVKDFVSFYHSDVQAKQFCSMFSSDIAGMCLNVTNSYYSTF